MSDENNLSCEDTENESTCSALSSDFLQCEIFDDDASSLSSSKSFGSVTSLTSNSSKTKFLFPKIDTVESLRPEEVRWFYKEDLEKKWRPFLGYDSLRVECVYRELIHRKAKTQTREDESEAKSHTINVRGGLYEADVEKKQCYPIYWSRRGQTSSLLRGTWFMENNWQPVPEGYADQIETEHLAKFENAKIDEDEIESLKGPLPVIHNIKFKEFFVDWYALGKVFLHSEATSSKFYRAVGTKLGLANSGKRLQRGYHVEAAMDDKPPDITHLVFVVHGIGQKMDTGNIVNRCADLREIVQRMKERLFQKLELDNKRVEFFPVEWRSSLRLDGDTVDSITPNKVRGLRTILNSSAMDILYYTSPLYRAEITQGLQTELNRLYSTFCARHPYFEPSGGQVSIVGHSLGSVIMYDIITGWNPIQLYDQYVSNVLENMHDENFQPSSKARGSAIIGNQLYFSLNPDLEAATQQLSSATSLVSELEKARKRVSDLECDLLKLAEKQHLKTPTLRFRLQNFFCVGSPLAVFLALRGVRPKGNGTRDHILPKSLCARLFNIYHPSDPVAYRLEPLILKHYSTIKPVPIHRNDSPNNTVAYERMAQVAYSAVRLKKQSKSAATEKETTQSEKTDDVDGSKSDKSPAKSGWSNIFRRGSKMEKDNIMSSEMTEMSETRETDKSSLPAEKQGETKQIMKLIEPPEKSAKSPPLSDTETEEEDLDEIDEILARENAPINCPELEYRLDYQVREGKMESSYLSALTSHTSYWNNQDVALFIMSQIFPKYISNTSGN